MTLTFLTPLAALLALGVVVPVVALLAVRRRARGIRATLALDEPPKRSLLVPLAALLAAGALLALAAAQPVVEWTRDREVRTDAEAFVVLDVSRSMLAQRSVDDPMRIERAKVAASTIRSSLSEVPVGVASLTDRVLPHLFPSADEDVFEATIERALAIERPPPRSTFLTGATSLDSLATVRGQRYFSPRATSRLVIVLTDGESQPVSNTRLGGLFRRSPRDRDRLRPVLERGREGLHSRGPRAAVPARPVSARDARPARSVDPGCRVLGRTGRCGEPQGSAAARERNDRRAGGARRSDRARAVSGRRGAPAARAPAVAAGPVDRQGSGLAFRHFRAGMQDLTPCHPSSANQGSTASGNPLSSMYEIARLANHTRARRARLAQRASHRLVAVPGAALLAGLRPAEATERERGAVDVASAVLRTTRHRRPGREGVRPPPRGGRRPRRPRNTWYRALLSSAPGIRIEPPNEIEIGTSQTYDPALDHGDGGIWIDGLQLAGMSTRQLVRCFRARPWRDPAGDHSDGGSTCVNVHSCCWRARSRLPRASSSGQPQRPARSGRRRGQSCSSTTRSRRTSTRTWVGNDLYATSLVVNNIWYGGQIRDDKANWRTRLFTGPPKLLKKSPLTTTFTFSPKAVWSDGKPVTCADWRATWQVYINPANNVISRTGYEDIKSVTVQGQDRHGRLQEGVRRLGVAHERRRLCRRTSSPVRT